MRVPKTVADRCKKLKRLPRVETSVNSFATGNPGSLRGCQRQSQTDAMYSGGSLEVETSLKSIGTVDPGSLRECQRQSQTDAMYTGGSLEVEISLKPFGANVLGRVPRSRLHP